ncbi:hypothetical protein [Staphylococcus capitis]|nr:hypothetical protein [Staphylococcus capitis]
MGHGPDLLLVTIIVTPGQPTKLEANTVLQLSNIAGKANKSIILFFT